MLTILPNARPAQTGQEAVFSCDDPVSRSERWLTVVSFNLALPSAFDDLYDARWAC